MKKFNIMNHVDILDQVSIIVTQPMPGHFGVSFIPLDKMKQVIIDEKALNVFNNKITEKAATLRAKDPNTVEFIKEFSGRLLSELFKTQLAILEDIKEPDQDPYAQIKKLHAGN